MNKKFNSLSENEEYKKSKQKEYLPSVNTHKPQEDSYVLEQEVATGQDLFQSLDKPSTSVRTNVPIYRIKIDYRIFIEEWNKKRVMRRIATNSNNDFLNSVKECISEDVKRLNAILGKLGENDKAFLMDATTTKLHESIGKQSFFRFMEEIIFQLKRLGNIRTSETYTAALNSFMRFRENNDVQLNEINPDLMMEYEAYLKTQGITMNTISFYNRILRAAYNRAVEKGLTKQCNPFKHVYTGIGKTVKRAISSKAIKRIKELDLSLNPSLDFARNMFLFSFYTRGMSFVDMAYLRKENLHNGILSYRRRKTGQQLFIKWEKCMQEIIDKYPISSTGYLLPIIKTSGDERRQYRNVLRFVNNKLKKISIMAGVQTNLTMYVSRHSWASIAKSKNVPLSIISEGMGHDSETTTQIYLASLNSSIIDKTNEMILRTL